MPFYLKVIDILVFYPIKKSFFFLRWAMVHPSPNVALPLTPVKLWCYLCNLNSTYYDCNSQLAWPGRKLPICGFIW